MLKHVVMFKIDAKLSEAEKQTAKNEIKAKLDALPPKIDLIRSFEVGLNVIESDRSFDLVLISEFDDAASLQAYAVHPDHVAVVGYIRTVCEKIVAADYLV